MDHIAAQANDHRNFRDRSDGWRSTGPFKRESHSSPKEDFLGAAR